MQPSTQQWGCLHVGGKHSPGGADERVDAQLVHPSAQRVGAECLQPRRDPFTARAITAEKKLRPLGMREVHPAFAGQQELAADRRHRVVQVDAQAVASQRFGGHQPGGATADHGD